MRRACFVALVAVALTVCAGCGSAKATPSVPHVNFAPRVAMNVTDDEPLRFTTAPSSGVVGSVVTTVRAGAVLLIQNRGSHDHRVVGTIKTSQVFDTGTMHPGDEVTIVLSTPGSLEARELTGHRSAHLTVTPKPGQKT